jgi:hypothetical protein
MLTVVSSDASMEFLEEDGIPDVEAMSLITNRPTHQQPDEQQRTRTNWKTTIQVALLALLGIVPCLLIFNSAISNFELSTRRLGSRFELGPAATPVPGPPIPCVPRVVNVTVYAPTPSKSETPPLILPLPPSPSPRAPPSEAEADWEAFRALRREEHNSSCILPDYVGPFRFDSTRYRQTFLRLNKTCAEKEGDLFRATNTSRFQMTVAVGAVRIEHCDGNASYSLSHPAPFRKNKKGTFLSRQLMPATGSLKLNSSSSVNHQASGISSSSDRLI